MPNVTHEARVKAFLAEAKRRDPKRYAAICEKHPVLTDTQLAHRERHEIALGRVDWGAMSGPDAIIYSDLQYEGWLGDDREAC